MKQIVKSLLVVMALFAGAQLYAQTENVAFSAVDEKPMFQGAEAGTFALWVSGQIKYPDEAYKNNVEGRVAMQFVIAKDGKVKDVRVLRSSGNELLDNEAMRVISMSPKWTPGKVDGKAVNVTFVFPVVFKLNNDAKAAAGSPIPYGDVEVKPTFRGEDPNTAFTKWMFGELQYPQEAMKNKIQGRASIEFVITKTGKVTDVKVVKSTGSKLLDDEALRVISMSPDWTPGKMKGKAVDVKFTYPVVFILR